ncbi:mitogen-activated protein kinase 15-like [Apium graveolens]|uniref:mitogen-activated protein kinase 15-like n=1 Tax=Apium graveolens TaxID=4045 RepID=UPI003D7BCF86
MAHISGLVAAQGSYGIVNSVTDAYINEKVAIKKISDVFRDVPRAVKVLREIKLLRLLHHPNIVEIKSILIPPSSDTFNDISVVLEYMDSDLRKFIASIDNLTAKDYISFMFQILHAVKFMHAANVYHLDLKPRNKLANRNGLIKVYDFGLSRVAFSEPSKGWHHTGYIGTRLYRAPEICGSELSKVVEMNEKKTIDFDSGWEIIQKGITKLKKILEDQTEPQFNSKDHMELYR